MTTALVPWLLVAAHVVVVAVSAVLISTNRRPSAAIAWILLIIFVPLLGVVAFLLLGLGKLPRSRRDKQREVSRLMEERTDGLSDVSHREQWPAWLPSAVTLNQNLGALPMVGGNSAELIEDYVGSIDAMITEIDRAESFVHVEFFILVLDDTTRPFFDALARACARGVPASCACPTTWRA